MELEVSGLESKVELHYDRTAASTSNPMNDSNGGCNLINDLESKKEVMDAINASNAKLK
jgi:hypothetical protein